MGGVGRQLRYNFKKVYICTRRVGLINPGKPRRIKIVIDDDPPIEFKIETVPQRKLIIQKDSLQNWFRVNSDHMKNMKLTRTMFSNTVEKDSKMYENEDEKSKI